MAKQKIKFGWMPCEGPKCRNGVNGQGRVVVMKNENDTLSYNCTECGRTPHARAGSEQHADWMAVIEKAPAAAAPAPAPAPKPAAEKKPDAKPADKPKPAASLLG